MAHSSMLEPSGAVDESWILSAYEPRTEPLYLANGYMGTSLDFSGGMLFESTPAPCYVRGVYTVGGPDRIDRLAALPAWNQFRYGHPSRVESYVRRLDLRRGVLRTELTLREDRGGVKLVGEIHMSRADRHAAAVHLTVESSFDGEIQLLTGLEAPIGGDAHVRNVTADSEALVLDSRVSPYDIDIVQTLRIEHEGGYLRTVAHQNGATAILTVAARAGEPFSAAQLSRVSTSIDGSDWQQAARSDHATYDEIRACHIDAWDRLWETDIEIEGDPDVQQFARAGLFYLWSTMREDDEWSIAPMGLSGNFYNGHVFWDAELWMYPSLLVTQPAMGRSCTAYRSRTLGAARERAAQTGHSGAQFPWEGGYTGEEMTPPWAETRDFQLHITADVAIGQWWYYLATGDLEWLRQHGWPVIRACAEYWVSRAEFVAEADRYEVSNVVCADEYAEHVDNDAFTNAAIRKALLHAVRAAEILGETAPREWSEIAGKIVVPYDSETGRHLEFDGYHGQVTKQADVELLAFPLEHSDDREQIARDLDYYGTVIDPHGPAMSFSVYSIVSAQLGRAEQAYEYLQRSFVPNTKRPFWSFSETPTNNEFFFCTGVGGALQTFLFGFTGLRLREDHIALGPILPPQWRSLRLRGLFVQGTRVDLEIERRRIVVRRHRAAGPVSADIDVDTGSVTFDWGAGPDYLCVESVGDGGQTRQVKNVARGEAVAFSFQPQLETRLRLVGDRESALLDLALRLPG